jgi:hypothetical protein
LKVKSTQSEALNDPEKVADKIFTKFYETGVFKRDEQDRNKISDENDSKANPPESLLSSSPSHAPLQIATEIKSIKTFSDLENFSKTMNINDLKFTKEEYDAAIDAMKASRTGNFSPKNSPLSEVENNLISHYTETGYRNMNDLLGGNLSRVANRLMEERFQRDELNYSAMAQNPNEVGGLRIDDFPDSEFKIEIKDDKLGSSRK